MLVPPPQSISTGMLSGGETGGRREQDSEMALSAASEQPQSVLKGVYLSHQRNHPRSPPSDASA